VKSQRFIRFVLPFLFLTLAISSPVLGGKAAGPESAATTAKEYPCCWNVADYNCANLDPADQDNHAWWCGDLFACPPGGTPHGGYGNNWDCKLMSLFTVQDKTAAATVRVQAQLNHDMEASYDWLYFEYVTLHDAVVVQEFTGVASGLSLDFTFTVQPDEYVGGNANQVHLQWHFRSDPSFSDEDCIYVSAGAAQLDGIRVSMDNGYGFVEVSNEDNESPLNDWFQVECAGEGVIRGSKWRDKDCNMVWDEDESFIRNWEIRLYRGNYLFRTTFTDEYGNYVFEEVPPGKYRVVEAIRERFIQTYPPWVSYPVEIHGDEVVEGLDFGNHRCDAEVPGCAGTSRGGIADEFDEDNGEEPVVVSPGLQAALQGSSHTWIQEFDPVLFNTVFGFTHFDQANWCWKDNSCVTGAQFTFRAAAANTQNNDAITFRHGQTVVWASSLSSIQADLNGDGTWDHPDVTTFTLDLANLPSWEGVTNILAALVDGDLDFMVGNDTGVDFVRLRVEQCYSPPSPSAVDEDGGLWARVHPNPANPRTLIDFEIPASGPTRLAVYDLKGRQIVTLVDEVLSADRYRISWDGRDEYGKMQSAGVYFYRLEAAGAGLTGKMLLLK
jgi:hypothetical protein